MTECYFCESTENIEEHHIVPQRFSGSDARGNLVELCHDCHWKLERLYNKDFWEAIGVKDPRATEKSHVRCDQHGCIESSIGHFQSSGRGRPTRVGYYCEDHAPNQEQDQEVAESNTTSNTDTLSVNGAALESHFNNHYQGRLPTEEEIKNERDLKSSTIHNRGKFVSFRYHKTEYRMELTDDGWVAHDPSHKN